MGVLGGPVCPPQSLGVLEGILDGIEVNGTEAKQGGVWVRPRGEQVTGPVTSLCQLLGNRHGHPNGHKKLSFVLLSISQGMGMSQQACCLPLPNRWVMFTCGRKLGTWIERCPFWRGEVYRVE